MPKIFISYRREDSQWPARSLRDALIPHVHDPRTDIFMDIDNIPLGVNFADHIGAQVDGCDVLLALIGPNWISLVNETGQRRLDDPKDFVRLEIGQALKRGIPVVPVLLDGAAMPSNNQLPDDLRELAMRHATEVRHATFSADAERLIRGLGLTKDARKPKLAQAPVLLEGGGNRGGEAAMPAAPSPRRSALLITSIAAVVVLVFGAAALFANPFNWRGSHPEERAHAPANDSADPPPPANEVELKTFASEETSPAPTPRKTDLPQSLPADNSMVATPVPPPRAAEPRQLKVTLERKLAGAELEGIPSISPDWSRILLVAGNANRGHIIDARTGKRLVDLVGHKDVIWNGAFSSDGLKVVTSAGDGSWHDDLTARIWDVRTGENLLTLPGHNDYVNAAAFSPDGTRVATASYDNCGRVWNARTGALLLEELCHDGDVESIIYSRDGLRIATASEDKTAIIWDAQTGTRLLTLAGHSDYVWSVAFSPDGSRIITGSSDNDARVWDAKTGRSLLVLSGHSDTVFNAAFSPDNTLVATASSDGTARIWDAKTGRSLASLPNHGDYVSVIVFSQDGDHLMTASGENTVWFWRIEE